MPDWFEEPAWWVVILVTAVASAVVTVLVQRAPPVVFRCVRNGVCRVNHWRKFVIGTKRTRAGVISRWKKAPLRVLRATVFRWFEADSQAWWECVHRVYESHNSAAARENAECLLWVKKEAADLAIRDVYNGGDHVLHLRHEDGWVEVATSASHKWYARGTHRVRVNRGWCPHADCSVCPMDEQEFVAHTEGIRAGR